MIDAERARSEARLASLRKTFADIVASAELSPPDDEHDPEGSTIAFERTQTAALIDQAERQLSELAEAGRRVRAGDYGVCQACGGIIGDERLAARPTARTCVDCA